MLEAVYVGSLSRKAISSTNLNNPELTGSNPNNLMAQYQAAVAAGPNPLSYHLARLCASAGELRCELRAPGRHSNHHQREQRQFI